MGVLSCVNQSNGAVTHETGGYAKDGRMRTPTIFAGGLAAAAAAAVAVGLTVAHADAPPSAPTSTPIKHVVVLFDENISFDHYFATYPNAANPPGQPKFVAKD